MKKEKNSDNQNNVSSERLKDLNASNPSTLHPIDHILEKDGLVYIKDGLTYLKKLKLVEKDAL